MGNADRKARKRAREKAPVKVKVPTPVIARLGFIYNTDKGREKMLRDRHMMPDQQEPKDAA